jgi:hypothetical protein
LPLTTTPHVIGPLNRSNCRTPPTVGLIPLSVALHICFPYCIPIATVFALAVPSYVPLFLSLKPSCHPLAFPICILYLHVLLNDLVEARHTTSTTKRRERCAVFVILFKKARVGWSSIQASLPCIFRAPVCEPSNKQTNAQPRLVLNELKPHAAWRSCRLSL